MPRSRAALAALPVFVALALAGGSSGAIAPAWSPDGKQIAFALASPSPHRGIWLVGATGRGRRQLTVGTDKHPSWSQHGSTIAFSRSGINSPQAQIFVFPAAGAATKGR